MLELASSPSLVFDLDESNIEYFTETVPESCKTFFSDIQLLNIEKENNNIVNVLSIVNEDNYYNFTGKDLKRIIMKIFTGNYSDICLECNSSAENITDNKNYKAEEFMENQETRKKTVSKSLKETILRQSHKFAIAKELKNEPIHLPEIEEDLAKFLFDDEENDK